MTLQPGDPTAAHWNLLAGMEADDDTPRTADVDTAEPARQGFAQA